MALARTCPASSEPHTPPGANPIIQFLFLGLTTDAQPHFRCVSSHCLSLPLRHRLHLDLACLVHCFSHLPGPHRTCSVRVPTCSINAGQTSNSTFTGSTLEHGWGKGSATCQCTEAAARPGFSGLPSAGVSAVLPSRHSTPACSNLAWPAGCVEGGLTPHQAFVCLGKEACLCYSGRLVREADEGEFRLQRHQQSLHWQMEAFRETQKRRSLFYQIKCKLFQRFSFGVCASFNLCPPLLLPFPPV